MNRHLLIAPQPGGGLSKTGQKPGEVVGPIVGVRPNKTGKSFLQFNGAETYEEWLYTVQDLDNEIKARQAAMVAK